MLTDLLSSVTQILDVTCIVPTRTYSLKTLGYNTSTYLWTLAGITVPQTLNHSAVEEIILQQSAISIFIIVCANNHHKSLNFKHIFAFLCIFSWKMSIDVTRTVILLLTIRWIIKNSLLACILLAYWLFISTHKEHINALFCMTIFISLNPIPYLNLTNTFLIINKQLIKSLPRQRL